MFDALDGMELKVVERLKAVSEPMMMVSDIPGRGSTHQELHDPQVKAAKLDSVGIRDSEVTLGELLTLQFIDLL